MIVREADLEKDALALVDAAHNFTSRMVYTDFLPDTETGFIASFGNLLALDGMKTIVAEHDGEIVGMLGMFFSPHLWNNEKISAAEVFMWTAPEAPATTLLAMIRAVRKMARGAIVTFKSLESSPDNLDKVYNRLGLTKVETSYMGNW